MFLYFISIYLLNVQCGHTKSTIMYILRFFVYLQSSSIQILKSTYSNACCTLEDFNKTEDF